MSKLFFENILSYSIAAVSVDDAVAKIFCWTQCNVAPKVFICANPHSLVMAENDVVFRKSLQTADLVTPDGAGIVLASRIMGGQIRERVTGSDIFQGVLKELNRSIGFSVFFLGSTEETLTAIRARMAVDFPNVRMAGTYSPPFKPIFSDDDNERIVAAINAAAPDVLWVGMTAPKQAKWIYHNKDKLNVKFIGAMGAVFDFYAGNVKRPPVFVQKIGLEWLYRWVQEPKRLWKRNVISTPKFIIAVLKQKFKGN